MGGSSSDTHNSAPLTVLHYLRIAVTALSLTACVLLIALWVRSHWTRDLVSRVTSSGQINSFGSNDGTVYFVQMPSTPMPRANAGSPVKRVVGFIVPRPQPPQPHGWRHSSGKVNERAGDESFQWEIAGGNTKIKFPHWLFVFVASAMAALPWLRLSFSLRTLLIAMTLLALGLGVLISIS